MESRRLRRLSSSLSNHYDSPRQELRQSWLFGSPDTNNRNASICQRPQVRRESFGYNQQPSIKFQSPVYVQQHSSKKESTELISIEPSQSPHTDRSTTSRSRGKSYNKSVECLPPQYKDLYRRKATFTADMIRSERSSVSTGHAFKCDIMVKHLRQRQVEKSWSQGPFEQGVVLKRAKDDFICKPTDLSTVYNGYYEQIKRLNVKVSMTVKTDVIESFLSRSTQSHMPFKDGLRLQVLPSMSYLAQCKKHHYAAFIRDSGILVVWDECPENLIARAEKIQENLVSILWKDSKATFEDTDDEGDSDGPGWASAFEDTVRLRDDESFDEIPRKTLLWMPILSGLFALLAVGAIGVGWRKLAIEVKTDHNFLRLLLLVPVPLQLWLGWFFFQSIVSGVAQMFGPVSQLSINSRYYSSVRSKRLQGNLPHVTIQCPIYKEGLWAVIDPTMASVRAAISTYEMQGGSANIFVNDDGIQLLTHEEARERINYYEEHNIGWVARPKHNSHSKDGGEPFIRPGKFKKASNMNYGMSISVRIEDKLHIERPDSWTQYDEYSAYLTAMEEVVKEDKGRTWAGGDIRIGDYILLLDSDSRVPIDCFLDAVSEMEASPHVAIIQYSSGVMNVTTSFFEKGITFFTKLIFTAIKFAVASGDVAPFIGHNAILRWSAIQEIAFKDRGIEKYWSEDTVSEDFDMALRLQGAGYDIRFATYFGEDFKEGVSLTVYDELARWEKYAYGCAELIFHPFRYWLVRGPFTPLFWKFLFGRMSIMSKLTIMAYVGTYYAIGSAWVLTLMNYFCIGWLNGSLDQYYLNSYNVYVGIVVVFNGLGTVSLAVMRYRNENRNFFAALFENLTWLLLLTIFLGGISMHVSQAILCHLFSIDMTWGATSKEETRTSFFQEVPTILTKFKFTFCYCLIMITTMLVFAGIGPVGVMVPYDWQITEFTAIYPMSVIVGFHFLMPLILNPGLMQFSF